jgi:hypothetical protein
MLFGLWFKYKAFFHKFLKNKKNDEKYFHNRIDNYFVFGLR